MAPTTPLGKIIGSGTMFFGVLVIAFPVSVFSELWSKELKIDSGGSYRSITDSLDDDQLENEEALAGLVTPPKFISARVDKSQFERSSFVDHANSSSDSIIFKLEEVEPKAEDQLGMSDAQAIRHYMSVIDDAQGKIRELLQRMDIPE